MSPRRFLGDDHKQQSRTGIMINGPKPTPLKLKQESHKRHDHQKIRKPPIIIYVHSPEVIHTKPHDFMALVQKLTGGHSVANSNQDDQEQDHQYDHTNDQDHQYDQTNDLNVDNNEFSNDSGVITHERNKISMKSKTLMFDAVPLNQYIADIPLFTPNTTADYFFSPQQF